MISLRQQGIWFAPFPVSPSGGKRGAPPPPLRYGSGKAPAQSRTLISVLGRQGKGLHFYLAGLRPVRESSNCSYKPDKSLANKSGHLDVLRTKARQLALYALVLESFPDQKNIGGIVFHEHDAGSS